MFVSQQDKNNMTSFVTGYELGRGRKSHFSSDIEFLVSNKYKQPYSGDGWPGQIERLSKKWKLPWPVTFKQIALEIITAEKYGLLNKKQVGLLRGRVVELLKRIEPNGNPWFNETWLDQWQSFCLFKQDWFVQIWSRSELKIIKAICNEVKVRNVFADKKKTIPSRKLTRLKEQFISA
jgi:hypothetical protein